MEEKLIDKSIKDFAELLASKSPTPGGGGAAALAGALAAALCNMAAAISASPKREALYPLCEKAEELRVKFLEFVDEDARSFEPLSKAYSKPRSDPDYAETIREASIMACVTPTSIVCECCMTVVLLEEALEYCSKLLLSDIACAAELCIAAFRCASYNIYVNTRTLPPQDAQPINEGAERMLEVFIPRAEAISAKIMKSLRGED